MYHAHVKNQPENLNNESCLIGISAFGQANQKGQRFQSILDLVTRIKFKNAVFLVNDAGQRFNLAIKTNKENPEELLYVAILTGTEWLDEHREQLKNFPVIKYSDILKKNEFKEYLKQIQNLYQQEKEFKNEIEKAADQYLLRFTNQKNQNISYDESSAKKHSISFLLEEYAAICFVGKLNKLNYFCYPSKEITGFSLYKKMVLNNEEEKKLIQWLEIRITKRKQNNINCENSTTSGSSSTSNSSDEDYSPSTEPEKEIILKLENSVKRLIPLESSTPVERASILGAFYGSFFYYYNVENHKNNTKAILAKEKSNQWPGQTAFFTDNSDLNRTNFEKKEVSKEKENQYKSQLR